jgi:hypothetical protein
LLTLRPRLSWLIDKVVHDDVRRWTPSPPAAASGYRRRHLSWATAASTLEALVPLPRQKDDQHLKTYQRKMDTWRQEMHALEAPERVPGGDRLVHPHRHLRPGRRGQRHLSIDPGGLAPSVALMNPPVEGVQSATSSGPFTVTVSNLSFSSGGLISISVQRLTRPPQRSFEPSHRAGIRPVIPMAFDRATVTCSVRYDQSTSAAISWLLPAPAQA